MIDPVFEDVETFCYQWRGDVTLDLLRRIGYDFELQCWRNHFEVENFAIFWLIIEQLYLLNA